MHWKLKENIRLNKVCSTCGHGSFIMSNKKIELCLKEESIDMPELAPRIKTCLFYEERNKK